MADFADDAAERADFYLDVALANRQPTGPKWTGRCATCEAAVEFPQRWCDTLCRDEWESEQHGDHR